MSAPVPSFDDFRAAYPDAIAEDQVRLGAAWDALTEGERHDALFLLERWLTERRFAGFRFIPPARTYLLNKSFAALIDTDASPLPQPPSFEEFWAAYDPAPCFHKRRLVAEAEFALLPDHERVFAGRYAANEAAARKLLFSVGVSADQWLRERRYRDLMSSEQHLAREARL